MINEKYQIITKLHEFGGILTLKSIVRFVSQRIASLMTYASTGLSLCSLFIGGTRWVKVVLFGISLIGF